MANTTFNGPVRSENGFQSITKNATTGAVTVDATLGAATSVDSVTVSDFVALTAITTAELPAAAAGNAGQVRLISDNGAGDDEYCLVISTGAAWVTAVGAALS
jgi:hypothetical protein